MDIATLGIAVDSRKVKTAQRDLDGLTAAGGRAEKKGFAISKAYLAVGAAVAAAASGFAVREIVQTTKRFELLQARLETVQGSALSASIAFDSIQQFAATTPFQLDQVVDAFVRLRNLGLDPSAQALTAYGNIAASQSKRITDVIEAVADASTGEFERLKEFGIKARQQGDSVAFTFRGVETTVKKSGSAIEGYLRSIGDVEFGGAMDRQSETVTVAFSNLEDSVSKLILKIDGETGLTNALKNGAIGLTDFFNSLAGESRSIKLIESDIDSLSEKLENFTSKKTRRGNRGDSKSLLQAQLEDLKAELLEAQLSSTNVESLSDGVAAVFERIENLKESISARQSAGESETKGTGRSKSSTELGREIAELKELEIEYAAAIERRSEVQKSADEIQVGKALAAESEARKAADEAAAKSAKDRADAEEELQRRYDSTKESLARQIELFDDLSEVSAIKYAIEKGELVGINEEQQKKLELMAAELDQLESTKEKTAELNELQKAAAEEYKEIWLDALNTFSSGVGDAVAGAIFEQENLGDAARAIVKDIGKQILSTLVEIGVKKLVLATVGKTALATETAASVAAAGITASAWATPAALVSLASFGANGVPATTAVASTVAVSEGLALSGVMHDGGSVPTDGTYFLQKGEFVQSKENVDKGAYGNGKLNLVINNAPPGNHSVRQLGDEVIIDMAVDKVVDELNGGRTGSAIEARYGVNAGYGARR